MFWNQNFELVSSSHSNFIHSKFNKKFGNLKSPQKSSRFDIRGSQVALFVPDIGGGPLGVTEKKEEKKDWLWSILVV